MYPTTEISIDIDRWRLQRDQAPKRSKIAFRLHDVIVTIPYDNSKRSQAAVTASTNSANNRGFGFQPIPCHVLIPIKNCQRMQVSRFFSLSFFRRVRQWMPLLIVISYQFVPLIQGPEREIAGRWPCYFVALSSDKGKGGRDRAGSCRVSLPFPWPDFSSHRITTLIGFDSC